MSKHLMDTKHIIDVIFDYEAKAIKTVPHQDTTHTLNLNASQDSVVAVVPAQSVAANTLVDALVYKKVALFVPSGQSFTLQVSGTKGGTLYTVASGSNGASMQMLDIACTEIKLVTTDTHSFMVLQG